MERNGDIVRGHTEVPASADTASLFAALGDGIRLGIVERLCREGPLPIVRLREGFDVSRQAVSKHLKALEAAGLLRSRREGRERIWMLRDERLEEARRHLETISAQWDRAIGRLRGFVEARDA